MENKTLNQVMLKQAGLTTDFETLVKGMSEDQLAHITQDLYWSIKKGKAFEDVDGNPLYISFDDLKALVEAAAVETETDEPTDEPTDDPDEPTDDPEPLKPTPAQAAALAVDGLTQLTDYTPNGTFVVAEDGSSEYTIDYAKFAADNRAIVNDYARMLGEMYRKGGVKTITFEGTEYTWDVNGTLKGSNYKAGDVTLVSAVTAKFAADMTSGAGAMITIVVDGQELTTTIKFDNAPSTVEVV